MIQQIIISAFVAFDALLRTGTQSRNQMSSEFVNVQQQPDAKFDGGPVNYGNPLTMNYVEPQTVGMSINGGKDSPMMETPNNRSYIKENVD